MTIIWRHRRFSEAQRRNWRSVQKKRRSSNKTKYKSSTSWTKCLRHSTSKTRSSRTKLVSSLPSRRNRVNWRRKEIFKIQIHTCILLRMLTRVPFQGTMNAWDYRSSQVSTMGTLFRFLNLVIREMISTPSSSTVVKAKTKCKTQMARLTWLFHPKNRTNI